MDVVHLNLKNPVELAADHDTLLLLLKGIYEGGIFNPVFENQDPLPKVNIGYKVWKLGFSLDPEL